MRESAPGERGEPPVVVPAAVLEGLKAVMLSGKANMLDHRMVQSWALRMGHVETVLWIEHNPLVYERGVFVGFVAGPEEGEG